MSTASPQCISANQAYPHGEGPPADHEYRMKPGTISTPRQSIRGGREDGRLGSQHPIDPLVTPTLLPAPMNHTEAVGKTSMSLFYMHNLYL